MKLRILTAEFMHETNTFSRIETDQQAFRNRYFLVGAEAIAERGEQNTELAGFLDIGRKYDWQIDHVFSAAAGPSGTMAYCSACMALWCQISAKTVRESCCSDCAR
jgi:microcystin degradation protein MlrC